jgi:hypothetical protein
MEGTLPAKGHTQTHMVASAERSTLPVRLPDGARLVHIGPYKTGTTAIQAAFHLARGEAERQGVHYAGYGRQPMSAVMAGIGKPSPWSADRKPPNRALWQQLVREIRGSSARRVVLSSEWFSDAEPDAIRRVVEDLGGDQVHIAVTLRPLAKVIPSQWQQYVQNRLTEPFDGWLDALLNKPRGTVTPTFWFRHRHDELTARWADVVGPDRITAIVLDDRDHGHAYRAFEQLTGLTTGTLVPDPQLANRSMSLAEIEVIRAFNIAYKEAGLPAVLYQRVMRTGAAQLMERRSPGADEGKVELPPWAIEPVAEIARTIVEGIGRSRVRVVGDLGSLTKVSTTRTADTPSVHVSPEVAAAAAMGVLLASGLARGTAWPKPDPGGEEADAIRPNPPRPIAEPAELFRVSTIQLGIVLVRRLRAAVRDRISRLLRRS